MNYKFSQPLTDLAGDPVKDGKGEILTVGRLLANTLASQAKGDPLKFLDWARSLYKNDPINLDKSDVKTLREFIENSDQLTVMAKGQMLELLDQPVKQDNAAEN